MTNIPPLIQNLKSITSRIQLTDEFIDSRYEGFAEEMRRRRPDAWGNWSDFALQRAARAYLHIIREIPYLINFMQAGVLDPSVELSTRFAIAWVLRYVDISSDLIDDDAPYEYGLVDDAIILRAALAIFYGEDSVREWIGDYAKTSPDVAPGIGRPLDPWEKAISERRYVDMLSMLVPVESVDLLKSRLAELTQAIEEAKTLARTNPQDVQRRLDGLLAMEEHENIPTTLSPMTGESLWVLWDIASYAATLPQGMDSGKEAPAHQGELNPSLSPADQYPHATSSPPAQGKYVKTTPQGAIHVSFPRGNGGNAHGVVLDQFGHVHVLKK